MSSMTAKERRIRLRLRDDFTHYAKVALKIRPKSTEGLVPFVLNDTQWHVHRRFEAQLAETGMVRALVLKGRQPGVSTLTEGRFFHKVTHKRGVRAFILTHHDDATRNLFDMAKRFYENLPALVKPSLKASNARELIFDRLDSGYTVGTAGTAGVGRSSTIQYFHGSELALWANADEHMAGALQAVPNMPGSEVILESTSKGRQGLFWQMCEEAKAGQGRYQLIFVPWFWQREYRLPVPPGFERTAEEADHAAEFGLDDEQLHWRREKLRELRTVVRFRQEYPATVEEAFTKDAEGALWKRELIDGGRTIEAPKTFKRIVVGIDPSGGDGPGNDEVGIVACGLGHDGVGYVLEDGSGRLSASEWGVRAVAVYQRHKADRIVVEKNFGGDMVELVLRTVDKSVPVRMVSASRGKDVRAEPIAALYEQGKVHHVGTFIALEDELTTWKPGDKRSPNRLDALVWALTELMIGHQRASPDVPIFSATAPSKFYGR